MMDFGLDFMVVVLKEFMKGYWFTAQFVTAVRSVQVELGFTQVNRNDPLGDFLMKLQMRRLGQSLNGRLRHLVDQNYHLKVLILQVLSIMRLLSFDLQLIEAAFSLT